MIEAKIIEDSISEIEGKRITTIQVKFHRFILPEFNTHRVFSRNFSSSRAIPTSKLIEQVENDPAIPVYWGRNQPGMQAEEELTGREYSNALNEWRRAAAIAANVASNLSQYNVHKQIVNRVLEPYLWVNGIVTSTEWDNWDLLRCHKDAQPEIQELAHTMRVARNKSDPNILKEGEWHLPYITHAERKDSYFRKNQKLLRKISAARCCGVSYLKHDGALPKIEDDLALFDRLAKAEPIHASPLEHQATPNIDHDLYLEGNFIGWIQFRKLWEQELYACAQPPKIFSLKDLMRWTTRIYE